MVLKVGDVQMTQAQFDTFVADLVAQQGPADLSKREIGDNYVKLLILSQQAVANHLDTSPEVLRQLAIDRNQILSNAEFARLRDQAKPTPEEIAEYYKTHGDDFDTVKVRRLFVWTKPPNAKAGEQWMTEQQAKDLAKTIQQTIASGGDLKKLTQEHDKDVVVDVQPLDFQRGEMPAEMDKFTFSLTKEGEWATFKDAPDGLVMIQLVKRGRLGLAEVTPQIEKTLQIAKLKVELQGIKKSTTVWMDEQYFGPPVKKKAASTAWPQGDTD